MFRLIAVVTVWLRTVDVVVVTVSEHCTDMLPIRRILFFKCSFSTRYFKNTDRLSGVMIVDNTLNTFKR